VERASERQFFPPSYFPRAMIVNHSPAFAFLFLRSHVLYCTVLQIIVDSEIAKKKLAQCPWAASSDEYNLLTVSTTRTKSKVEMMLT
jgi:hypothetical protein